MAEGATVICITAGWPGASDAVPGPLTVKPSTVKVEAAEVPPPGAGLVTVTSTLPADETSVAGIAAESLVALTNVVACALPLKFTTDFATKFVPFTVNVNAAPPAACVVPRVVIVGGGVEEEFTVKICGGADGPVVGAGFVTVTLGVPAAAMSDASIEAVTLELLTNAVVLFAPWN